MGLMIEVSGLRKSFRSRHGRKATAVDAVRGVDFSVERAEIFGFLGPNGAGKSTTLRMLATLLRPDGGDATARASVEPTQGDALARREALWQLDAALETIDVGRRAVLVLHEIEEMTAPEIAQVLSIPLNTVYSRLRVARLELEAALARQGGGP